MSEPTVFVGFANDQRHYRPGDILSGHYRVEGIDPAQLEALELSVLWHTEGKGGEDLAVHLFQRFLADDNGRLDGRQAGWFSTELPPSPLSYEGRIVKIHWCVRVRLFFSGGREIVREEPFQLGHVSPAPVAAAPAAPSRAPGAAVAGDNSKRLRKSASSDDGAAKSAPPVGALDDSREADFSASRTVEPPPKET